MKKTMITNDPVVDIYDKQFQNASWGIWSFCCAYHNGGWGRYFEVECGCCGHHEAIKLNDLYTHPSCPECEAKEFITLTEGKEK